MARDQEVNNQAQNSKLSRRQFLTRTMFAAGGLVLAACTTNPGGTSNKSSGGTSGGSTSASSGTTISKSSGSSKKGTGAKVTLVQWYHQYGEKGTHEAVQRYADEYTKQNPNVTIQIGWTPGNYDQKLASALLTSKAPDVFEWHLSRQLVQQNQVADLTDLYTPSLKKDFANTALQLSTVNNKLYGVQIIIDPQLVYYRPSMLKKAGVSVPQTYDDLKAAVHKLNSGRVKGLYLAQDGFSSVGMPLPWSNGEQFIKNDKITFDDSQTVEAITALRDLYKSGDLLTGYTTDWTDPSAFLQGATAMQWTGMWTTPQMQDTLKDDFGVMPWPKFDASGRPVVYVGGWTEFVNPKSKNVDEAKKFVKWLWMENTKAQKDFAVSYGFHIPPRNSVAADTQQLKSGAAKDIVDYASKYGIITPILWSGDIGTTYGTAVTNIVKKGADPKSTLSKAAKKAQSQLDQELK